MTVTSDPQSLPHTPYSSDAHGAIVHSWRAGRWYSWAFEVENSAYDAGSKATVFNFSLTRGGNQGSRGGDAGQEVRAWCKHEAGKRGTILSAVV